ncbi:MULTISPECIES: carbohydrate kinase family protein [unclassified Microbacterium]|uniref:carbohydrate kinase family protein n=1 Tax=unclassified Microbacterium TaxID=2609290 RepID=UPI0034443640
MTTPRILVVGEALIDIVDGVEYVGGSPANVALGLGRLGADVRLLTALGEDERGRRIAGHLDAAGARVLPESFLLDRTSTATATVGDDGSAHYEFRVEWRVSEASIPECDLMHVGSIACLLEPGASRVLEMVESVAARVGRVTFDPNIRPALIDGSRMRERVERIAGLASAVKLSDEDAALIYPGLAVGAVLDELLALGVAVAVVTRGAEGAVLASQTARVEVPAVVTHVVDTVGAGDSFMATLVSGLSETADWDISGDALSRLGARCAAAAGITVGRAGADLPDLAELESVRA